MTNCNSIHLIFFPCKLKNLPFLYQTCLRSTPNSTLSTLIFTMVSINHLIDKKWEEMTWKGWCTLSLMMMMMMMMMMFAPFEYGVFKFQSQQRTEGDSSITNVCNMCECHGTLEMTFWLCTSLFESVLGQICPIHSM